jgi:hypothetical protein
MQKALESGRRVLGEEYPSTLSAMSNLAITLKGEGKLDEAAMLMEKAAECSKRVLGEEHL